jgi:heme-degrading monooxygenase HmoA
MTHYFYQEKQVFIALYEFEVVQGKEDAFRQYWLKTTQGIYKESGSLGSRLHKTNKSNIYVGYTQWPSQEVWSNGELTDDEYLAARARMRECLVASRTIYEMEVTDDYLQSAEFKE